MSYFLKGKLLNTVFLTILLKLLKKANLKLCYSEKSQRRNILSLDYKEKDYCKTLNICGIKFSLCTENDILAHFNFGVHDTPWLQIVKKIAVNFHIFVLISIKQCIVSSIRIASSMRF